MGYAMNDIEALRRVLSFDPSTGVFRWLAGVSQHRRAGDVAGCINASGYCQIRYRRQEFKAHRLAWAFTHGRWPAQCIDHINGKRSDNRPCNLRDVSEATNNQNRRAASRNSSCGFLGVTPFRSKFQARIWNAGRLQFLGAFETPEDAHAAYVEAKRQLHAGNTL